MQVRRECGVCEANGLPRLACSPFPHVKPGSEAGVPSVAGQCLQPEDLRGPEAAGPDLSRLHLVGRGIVRA